MKTPTHSCPVSYRSSSFVTVMGAFFALVLLSKQVLAAAPQIQPREKTSFQEVARHLNQGGDAYVYLSTAQWGQMLVDKIEGMKQMFLGNAQSPEARTNIEAGFQLADRIVRDLGLLEIDAFGASSVAAAPGLYHQRAILYHRPGNDKGMLWRLFGREPHPLNELKLLPPDTVMANFFHLDLKLAWTWWKGLAADSGFPKLQQGTLQLPQMLQGMGLDLDTILDAVEGPMGIVLTLDQEKTVTIPGAAGQSFQVPTPSVMFVAKVRNDALYQATQRFFAANPKVIRVDEANLKMLTIPVALPVPIPIRPSLAQANGYFFLATTDQLVRDALSVLKGERAGLTESDIFKKLSRDVPTEGVAFQYLDPAFMKTWGKMVSTMMQGMSAMVSRNSAKAIGPMMAMQALVAGGEPLAVYKVGVIDTEGSVTVGNATRSASAMAGTQLITVPVAMVMGGIMPALTQARAKAKQATCMSHLKQIGLALMMYAADHEDNFPDDPKLLTNYLGTETVWGCPARPNPARDVEHRDYVYLGAGSRIQDMQKPAQTVIAHDKPGNHADGTMCFLFADGHVRAVHAASLDEALRKHGWQTPGQ